MIDWTRLRAEIIGVAVGSVNNQLYIGLSKAERDVPVRKVFRSGRRQQVRFKTADEIEADRELRSRLGLAPEILATPEGIARVRKSGRSPSKGLFSGGQEYGFARVAVGRDRTNSWEETGVRVEADRSGKRHFRGARLLDRTERHLKERDFEGYLSGRGRYELKSGRATSQRQFTYAELDIEKGEIKGTRLVKTGIGPTTIGGGLRRTLRVIEARADQFPVIKGWLVAGDKEHDYAKYQELGTRHNAAHPFLRPRLPEWKVALPAQLRRDMSRRRAGK